ncbi:MAG: hypothetical protein GY839_05000 [candidate division Zixibacteria bacterium]|nr:hypothetical protein [candidate division Zixibacteria bacterium]
MKYCLSFILCLQLTGSALAQEAGLTGKQMREFNQLKLTIEPKDKPDNYRRWKSFYGDDQITELAFFTITGDTDKAKLAETFKKEAKQKLAVGGVLILAGLGLILAENSQPKSSEDKSNNHKYNISLPFFCFGVGFITAGLAQNGQNRAPYSEAVYMANDYNQKLMIQIMTDF